ncbi:hypothetical protein [Brumimicrobium mesophilum]|uniref:hypothetical protein n=1 Tax=Brumimicrobium mesophilum TaxID=392717 RepID=UPI000D14384B|nr:hypothetical protein [Brumimicrobium mesophilum]
MFKTTINRLVEEIRNDEKTAIKIYGNVVESKEFVSYLDLHTQVISDQNKYDANVIINSIDDKINPKYVEQLGIYFRLIQPERVALPMSPGTFLWVKKTLITSYDKIVYTDCDQEFLTTIIDKHFNFNAFDKVINDEKTRGKEDEIWSKYNSKNWIVFFDGIMSSLFNGYRIKRKGKYVVMLYKTVNQSFNIGIEYDKKDCLKSLEKGFLKLPEISINLYSLEKIDKVKISNATFNYAPAFIPIHNVISSKKTEIDLLNDNAFRMDFFRVLASSGKIVYCFDDEDANYQKRYLFHYYHYHSLFAKAWINYISKIVEEETKL